MDSHTRQILHTCLNDLPHSIRKDLPEAYTKIGDILIIDLPPALLPFKKAIGKAYQRAFNVKTVMQKGKINGEYRVPDFEVLAGTETVTLHKENHILYKLDLSKVMFSPGNISERIRMSTLPQQERVVDMFAGIGYFTLPIARFSHSHVEAIEKNEDAYDFLCENVMLNKVDHLVVCHLTDCKTFTGKGDRVIMGHPDAHQFLDKAFEIVEKGFIHYHEFVPESRLDRPFKRLEKAADKAGARIAIHGLQKIKKFAPGVWHIVCDVRVL